MHTNTRTHPHALDTYPEDTGMEDSHFQEEDNQTFEAPEDSIRDRGGEHVEGVRQEAEAAEAEAAFLNEVGEPGVPDVASLSNQEPLPRRTISVTSGRLLVNS